MPDNSRAYSLYRSDRGINKHPGSSPYNDLVLRSWWPEPVVRNNQDPLLNIKRLSRYGEIHDKDKTVVRPSNLSHGDPYTGETVTLYWDSPMFWHPNHSKSKYVYNDSMIVTKYTCLVVWCRGRRGHENSICFSCVLYSVYTTFVYMSVTSYDHQTVSNNRKLDCFFNNSLRLTTKKSSRSALLTFCRGNLPVTKRYLSQKTSKEFPWHDVIMSTKDVGSVWDMSP